MLRALAQVGFSAPTPIQARVIPLALAGRDVCGSAATGSGKTAAFALPALERVARGRSAGERSATRVLILLPTRELAAQCEQMTMALAAFTDATTALIVGGAKDVRRQEALLRTRPDVVIGTPGRLVDHLTNSHGVHLDDVELVVLDEADRLLELGFEDEVKRVLSALPGGFKGARVPAEAVFEIRGSLL